MTIRHKIPPAIFFKDIPKRFSAVGGLIFNEKDEVLIVKQSYRDHWNIPGGITDCPETPQATVLREIEEELGIIVTAKRMLCMDVKDARADGVPESFQIIFEINPLTPQQMADIRIDNDEIVEFAFVSMEEAKLKLSPSIGNRVAQSVKARRNNTVFYLENGENPFGKDA